MWLCMQIANSSIFVVPLIIFLSLYGKIGVFEASRQYMKHGRSSNGRTTDFGSVYLGSNPSLPAKSALIIRLL